MAIDLKQVAGGILTLTMFVMLGNMIKREHFSADLPDSTRETVMKFSNASSRASSKTIDNDFNDLWTTSSGSALSPCWNDKITDKTGQSKGFIQFVLSHGPHYHFSQVADALVVAKYLGATLVLPKIKGRSSGESSEFEEIYNVEKFMQSIGSAVEVARELPNNRAKNTELVKIPHRVTEEYIAEKVEPLFKKTGSIMLSMYYPSIDMKIKETLTSQMDAVRCLGLYNALQFNSHIQSVANEMLMTLQRTEDGTSRKFVAIDLRISILQHKGCENGEYKKCFGVEDIGIFLRKVGVERETPLYLTQPTWHDSLSSLKDIFPNIYIKESLMPSSAEISSPVKSEIEKALDFYICIHSDVFVPAISGMFYANVAGQRIAAGRTQILVPSTKVASSAMLSDAISRYVIDRSHLAYSCFCYA